MNSIKNYPPVPGRRFKFPDIYMALSESQQIFEHIKRAKHILITGKQDADGDTVGSALAFFLILQKLKKRATITLSEFSLPPTLSFLPAKERITDKLGSLQKLVLRIDTSSSAPAELTYDHSDQKLSIYITPKQGTFSKDDVTIETSQYTYDLIVILGAPDMESLGAMYHDNPDFFYQVPIINIDHLPNNEYFGQINMVELTSSSVSEILYTLFTSWEEELIDDDIATCLYTGMVIKTRSFKNPHITPQTLHIASRLITQGADREKIITHLYRTKSVNVLKLWGRALARLQLDSSTKCAWTVLNQQDFILSGTSENDLAGIIDELITETPQAEIVALIYESDKQTIKALIHSSPKINVLHLMKKFNPQGHKQLAKLSFPKRNLIEIEREVTQELIDQIKRMGVL